MFRNKKMKDLLCYLLLICIILIIIIWVISAFA
jgi:hypothetical protein